MKTRRRRVSPVAHGLLLLMLAAALPEPAITVAAKEAGGDATPPQAEITAAPAALTNGADARFAYASSEPGSAFECKLDGAPFAPCDPGGHPYTGLKDGRHTFKVRAIDPAGNPDRKPATHAWKVDTTPPDATIGDRPPETTEKLGATFSF